MTRHLLEDVCNVHRGCHRATGVHKGGKAAVAVFEAADQLCVVDRRRGVLAKAVGQGDLVFGEVAFAFGFVNEQKALRLFSVSQRHAQAGLLPPGLHGRAAGGIDSRIGEHFLEHTPAEKQSSLHGVVCERDRHAQLVPAGGPHFVERASDDHVSRSVELVDDALGCVQCLGRATSDRGQRLVQLAGRDNGAARLQQRGQPAGVELLVFNDLGIVDG